MGKCDLCKDGLDKEVQAFTLGNPEMTMNLCRVHYEFMQNNNRVTGKLVETKCKACHQPTGYEWVKYRAPGRKKKGAKGNTKLDDFFDMRSKIERELGPKKVVVKKKSPTGVEITKSDVFPKDDKEYEKLAHEDDAVDEIKAESKEEADVRER